MAKRQPHQTPHAISERRMREVGDRDLSPPQFFVFVFPFVRLFLPFIHFLSPKFSFRAVSHALCVLQFAPISLSSFCLLFFTFSNLFIHSHALYLPSDNKANS